MHFRIRPPESSEKLPSTDEVKQTPALNEDNALGLINSPSMRYVPAVFIK